MVQSAETVRYYGKWTNKKVLEGGKWVTKKVFAYKRVIVEQQK